MSEVSFGEQEILDEVCAATGLSDFGSDYLDGFRMLLRTYDVNAYSEKGRRGNRRRLVQLLSTRQRIEKAFKEHPEIREREISAPMVLTGLPRSGTSALFSLLGADPAVRPLRMWETQFPDPMEGLEPGASDPRRDAIEAHFAKTRENNPEFTKIHYTSADTPEECVLLHAYAMHGVQMGVEVMLEPYASWYRDQDLLGMYAYYADLLRLLDWQRPGERWLLKAPAHMWGIDALTSTFPDVSIVWSHRNPLACIASICSMTHVLMKNKLEIDSHLLGPVVMDFYATSLERGLQERDRLDPGRFVDVSHDEFVDDSMKVAERIYGQFDLPLQGATRASLVAHIESHPKDRHGTHEYKLDDYGLTSDAIRERFAGYAERFKIDMG
ncbi:MAG: sulfotransferase [bacterium]|nr:sulfotransferase [bacterium]